MTMLILPHGQGASRGLAISFVSNIAQLMHSLPCPPGGSGMILVAPYSTHAPQQSVPAAPFSVSDPQPLATAPIPSSESASDPLPTVPIPAEERDADGDILVDDPRFTPEILGKLQHAAHTAACNEAVECRALLVMADYEGLELRECTLQAAMRAGNSKIATLCKELGLDQPHPHYNCDLNDEVPETDGSQATAVPDLHAQPSDPQPAVAARVSASDPVTLPPPPFHGPVLIPSPPLPALPASPQPAAAAPSPSAAAANPAQARIPRRFRVRVHCVLAALEWLRSNNLFYADCAVNQQAAAELRAEEGRQEAMDHDASPDAGGPSVDVSLGDLQHGVALEADPNVRLGAGAEAMGVDTGNHNQQQQNRRMFFNMQRSDGQPVSFFTHDGVEAMCFPQHYPTGKNHWNTARPQKCTLSMWFRGHVLNEDFRFVRDPLYICWALSVFHISQLRGIVDVALRQWKGAPTRSEVRVIVWILQIRSSEAFHRTTIQLLCCCCCC